MRDGSVLDIYMSIGRRECFSISDPESSRFTILLRYLRSCMGVASKLVYKFFFYKLRNWAGLNNGKNNNGTFRI